MDSLQDIVGACWGEHATKTAEVADRLEAALPLVAAPSDAPGWMNLVVHAIGDHLGDRARARDLCERAVAQLGEEPGSGAWTYLAVARHLAGDAAAAAAAEAHLGGDDVVRVRIDMIVSQGRAQAGEWEAADTLYRRALSLAETLPAGHAAERAVAITSNNVASEALPLAPRTPLQDALMETAAHAARTYWVRVGTWVNDERADYLLALVHNALGRPEEGRTYAERALATIAANGEENVDQAFLHLARAAAYRDLGNAAEHAASLARADELAAAFDPSLVDWFQGERAKSV